MVADSWGDLAPNMESAPTPWLVDEALTEDAIAILNWLCRSPRPLDRYHAAAFAVVVFHHKAGAAANAEARAWVALDCLRTAGYMRGPAAEEWASDPMWSLVWKWWPRPSGEESITLEAVLGNVSPRIEIADA